jgi:hypothetical protein
MILYLNNMRFRAYKNKKPKMNNIGGMQWAVADMKIDGASLLCHYDSRFGNNIYFELNDCWYKITIEGIYYNDIKKKVDSFCIHPSKTVLNFSSSLLTEESKHSISQGGFAMDF